LTQELHQHHIQCQSLQHELAKKTTSFTLIEEQLKEELYDSQQSSKDYQQQIQQFKQQLLTQQQTIFTSKQQLQQVQTEKQHVIAQLCNASMQLADIMQARRKVEEYSYELQLQEEKEKLLSTKNNNKKNKHFFNLF
jgi:hypothetical protein